MIYKHHVEHNGEAGWKANHIASNLSYEETTYRGTLAECDFAVKFDIEANDEVYRYGDGGRDFFVRLRTKKEGIRGFKLNVKAKSVQVSWVGLRRSGTHLRVPVKECERDTIYVFAIYDEQSDTAEVLAWHWGRTLIERDDQRIFENGNGDMCYVLPFEELRDLQELKDRMVRVPICDKCEAPGLYTGLGKWFCGDHRPAVWSPTSS